MNMQKTLKVETQTPGRPGHFIPKRYPTVAFDPKSHIPGVPFFSCSGAFETKPAYIPILMTFWCFPTKIPFSLPISSFPLGTFLAFCQSKRPLPLSITWPSRRKPKMPTRPTNTGAFFFFRFRLVFSVGFFVWFFRLVFFFCFFFWFLRGRPGRSGVVFLVLFFWF